MGWDSSVGIATRYGLDSQGIESRWGRDFLLPSKPAVGLTQCPIQWVPGVKRPVRGANHPPPSAEVKERVALYLYFCSGPSWPVIGRTLLLPLPLGYYWDLIFSVIQIVFYQNGYTDSITTNCHVTESRVRVWVLVRYQLSWLKFSVLYFASR